MVCRDGPWIAGLHTASATRLVVSLDCVRGCAAPSTDALPVWSALSTWSEVRAYRKQITVGGYTNKEFVVTALVGKYDLELDTDEATALLAD